MKPAVLLQTDFSGSSTAVASMKGVIRITDPEVDVYDLCHDIRSFSPWDASLSLARTEEFWPAGTVFVSVVDPGVGTARRASVARLRDGSLVVTPDNGTLTHLYFSVGVEAIREIDERHRYPAPERVEVFHGRDLFGYAGGLLASGKVSFEDIGREYPTEEIVICPEFYVVPRIEGQSVRTWIMLGSKHFGGVELYITNQEFRDLGYKEGDLVHVRISHMGEISFDEDVLFARSFGFVPQGAPVLYCGSSYYLSLDLNMDNFMARYGVDSGPEWIAELSRA